jgi:hypothetical protein
MLNPLPQQDRVKAVFLHDESATFALDEAAAAEGTVDDDVVNEETFDEDVVTEETFDEELVTEDIFDEDVAIEETFVEDVLVELDDFGALRSRCFIVVGRPPGPHSLLFSLIGRAWNAPTPDAMSRMLIVTKVERCMAIKMPVATRS